MRKVTADTITDEQIRELPAIYVAGLDIRKAALRVDFEEAKRVGDEAYYSAREDVALARHYCADEWNARHGGES